MKKLGYHENQLYDPALVEALKWAGTPLYGVEDPDWQRYVDLTTPGPGEARAAPEPPAAPSEAPEIPEAELEAGRAWARRKKAVER
jgi:hypothetical protein